MRDNNKFYEIPILFFGFFVFHYIKQKRKKGNTSKRAQGVRVRARMGTDIIFLASCWFTGATNGIPIFFKSNIFAKYVWTTLSVAWWLYLCFTFIIKSCFNDYISCLIKSSFFKNKKNKFMALQEFCIPCELWFVFSLKTIMFHFECSLWNLLFKGGIIRLLVSWDVYLKTMKHHHILTIVLLLRSFLCCYVLW